MSKLPQSTIDDQVLARIRESTALFKKRYETGPGGDTGPAGETHIDGYA
jgi:hypothetical protein